MLMVNNYYGNYLMTLRWKVLWVVEVDLVHKHGLYV